jgi:hypothetical protein
MRTGTARIIRRVTSLRDYPALRVNSPYRAALIQVIVIPAKAGIQK